MAGCVKQSAFLLGGDAIGNAIVAKTGLKYITDIANELCWQSLCRRDRLAAWGVGNCLIVARETSRDTTRLELCHATRAAGTLRRFADDTASAAWAELRHKLDYGGVELQQGDDASRMTDRIMAGVSGRREWESLEAAAAAILGPEPMTTQPPPTDRQATNNVGGDKVHTTTELEAIKLRVLDFELAGSVTKAQRHALEVALNQAMTNAMGKPDATEASEIAKTQARLAKIPMEPTKPAPTAPAQRATSSGDIAIPKKDSTILDLLNEGKEQTTLGAIFHWAAKSVLSDDPDRFAIALTVGMALKSAQGETRRMLDEWLNQYKDDDARQALGRNIAIEFAFSFLSEYPTREAAESKFSRTVPLALLHKPGFAEQQAIAQKILDLTVDEAKTLLAAMPLVQDLQAKMARQTTEPAPTGEPGLAVAAASEPQKPRVPKRGADLTKWKAVWKLIKSQAKQGYSNTDIAKWLIDMHPKEKHLHYMAETIADIIKAGRAGYLDD